MAKNDELTYRLIYENNGKLIERNLLSKVNLQSTSDESQLLNQEQFIVVSDSDGFESQPDSRCASQTSGKSNEFDLDVHPNAYDLELQGKNLGEQVKFLKEQGWTFRLISERLNVPMTNCYTAIKKLRLPDEYWDKIKAEVRLKRRAKEAVENQLTAEIFANIPTILKKRLQTESSPNDESEKTESEAKRKCSSMSNEFMSLSGRKHLTLEDGKIVQYWRDQGLTLQKIAEKLKMPMSSCYRAMKRYQVSQKANLIMGNESNNSSADTTNSTANAITVSVAAASTTASNIETNYTISEGNHSCSKSISELLLGMVNATMKNDAINCTNELDQQTNGVTNRLSFPESTSAPKEDKARSNKSNKSSINTNLWKNRLAGNHCLFCGLELQSLSTDAISQHIALCRSNSSQASPVNLTTQPSITVPLDTYNVIITVKDKMDWAATKIADSNDLDEIIGLMKVEYNFLILTMIKRDL
ncbi:unnamed protein product [Dracunculus medinensis]|uniref:HTH psq-type domain-containing protein n=1 Tax=Dracunculus medinensis TaxID=318479 RepID=A0A0N4URS2_DRAME|nr:unnamed protein product [Dracunculus medinensis]